MRSFNSRTREGCDLIGVAVSVVAQGVSIHAPGRGATRCRECPIQGIRVSIHAPGRGATSSTESSDRSFTVSIHAPGRGATDRVADDALKLLFQFTHPGGVRLTLCVTAPVAVGVSIHAPGRGATVVLIIAPLRDRHVSIHAPGRGATVIVSRKSKDGKVFQFTHPGGVRQHHYQHLGDGMAFQFTHPGGVRLDCTGRYFFF